MRFYRFRYTAYPLVCKCTVDYVREKLRNNVRKFKLSLNLGVTYSDAEVINGNVLRALFSNSRIDIPLNKLFEIHDNAVYVLVKGEFIPIKFYDEGRRRFYKLRCLGAGKAPTLEINGIHMHRIEGIDPLTDALVKVRSIAPLRNAKVLDVGTGLGYTAITSLRLGASEVTSIEIDENVLRIAEINPWSRDLAQVKIVVGNAYEVIREFSDGAFTHIIHDPPRFEMAGELYSLEFYRELYRVLSPKGKLFHYVGKPRLGRADIIGGVKRRLIMAGFKHVVWVEKALGFKAIK